MIVPVFPGVFSALGAVLANARFDYVSTSVMKSRSLDLAAVEAVYEKLEERARGHLEAEGITTPPVVERFVEMRYDGQNWELDVPMPLGAVTAESIASSFRIFCDRHRDYFGWALEDAPFEYVNFKLVVTVPSEEVRLPLLPPAAAPERVGTSSLYSRDSASFGPAGIYERRSLGSGAVVEGPAIIVGMDATTFVPPEFITTVDKYGNLLIEMEAER